MLIDWGLPSQEAVSVTASSGSGPFTLTVTRGIDGTTAQTHLNSAVIVHGVTAEDFNEPQVHISLGTSGTGINQVHGLANGSAVVGTTDTQTLTNKTLGATTVTGAISQSVASATGQALVVTNTTSAPSNPNVQLKAQSTTDTELGIGASGDANSRLQVLASGQVGWGPGSATTDTFLLRNASGELGMGSGNNFTVPNNLAVGGAQASASGSGVLGFNNATTAPTTTPSNAAVAYAKTGFLKWRGADGADYNSGSFLASLATNTTGFANTSLTTIDTFSTPLGIGTYLAVLFVPYLPTGTIGSTSTFALSFTGTATGGSLGNFTVHNTSAQLAQNSSPSASYVSPTHTAAVTLVQINATFIVTVAGTLTGQASVQTAADTMTIYAGSYMEVQPIA